MRVEETKCDLTKKKEKEAIKTQIHLPVGSLKNPSLNFYISKCAVVEFHPRNRKNDGAIN